MVKIFRNILCYTLALSLLLQNNVLTVETRTHGAYAAEQTVEELGIAASEDSTYEAEGILVQPEIISEIEEKRDIFSKEYFLSDNSRVLVVYPEPIHYETESGALAEIDNSMTQIEEGYANGSNSYEVVITNNTDSQGEVIYRENGYEIAWNRQKRLPYMLRNWRQR